VGATPPPPGGESSGGGLGAPEDMGGGAPIPPPPGPEPGGEAEITPESYKRDNLTILLESDNLTDSDSFIDLSKARNSLGEMEKELNKLLKD
jgi:hypothetical protein